MKPGPRILLVDDDTRLLKLIAIRLSRSGYETRAVEDGESALACLQQFHPDAVITDLQMDGMDGMALFQTIHARQPTLPVIILTAHGTIPDAVEAAQRGVFAYLTKPFDGDRLSETLARALEVAGKSPGMVAEEEEDSWRSGILTRSAAMENVLAQALRLARSDTSVLIQGESGTGKELVARAIHRASPRRDAPFVAVNCTAIPEALFESELFGHRKGAFTGATESRRGLMLAADGGTMLLDEIGDMPLAFQAKLLRALQQREVRPVGATDTIAVDIRVISATHQDLESAVERKTFREDLFYRLNVVTLDVPPLASRREDIPLLATHFVEISRDRRGEDAEPVTGFSQEAMELLISAAWPGNVRQLRNVVEQCVVLTTTPLIPANLVRRALRNKPRELLPFAEARARFERDYLVSVLQITGGNVAQAARLADRNRSEFYKLLGKHGIDPGMFRGDAE